jgi:hypothetical protein
MAQDGTRFQKCDCPRLFPEKLVNFLNLSKGGRDAQGKVSFNFRVTGTVVEHRTSNAGTGA